MPKPIVLITGAPGYVGARIVEIFLASGKYKVRGTVRDPNNPAKTAHLLALPNASKNLELVKADLLDGADVWDAAVNGCDYVLHTASPFILAPKDVERDLLQPALQGTTNVLEAVARHKAKVKKTVVTSSIAAIMGDKYEKGVDGYVFTEKVSTMLCVYLCICMYLTHPLNTQDWNETSTPKYKPYYYSKLIAERKAWEIATEHSLDMCCVNPTFVLGPCLSKTSSESINFVKNLVSGKFRSGVMDNRNGYVDVRDVAEAHLLVLEKGKPGERYLCSHGCGAGVGYLDYANAVKAVFPSLAGSLPTRNYGKAILYGVGWLKGYSWWEVSEQRGANGEERMA